MSEIKYSRPHFFISDKDKENYTIYDVVRTPHHKVVVLCSELTQAQLNTLQIYLEGQLVQHAIHKSCSPEHHQSYALLATIPKPLRNTQKRLEVKISSCAWTHTFILEATLFNETSQKNLVLSTLQKNNPLCWIKDWCLYYHRVHGVNLILLYDNGSDNRKELAQGLYQLAPNLEIRLIEWDFDYCMATQVAALNQCYHTFGSYASYFLNFDIDEYLIYVNGDTLFEYLQRNIERNKLYFHIPGCGISVIQMPNPVSRSTLPLRVIDFFAQRHTYFHSDNKTIYCYKENIFVEIHFNVSQDLQKEKESKWVQKLRNLLRRLFFKASQILWEPPFYPYHPYFNHYAGLTTKEFYGWRAYHKNTLHHEPYNTKLHCKDTRMLLMLEIASLNKDDCPTNPSES